MYTSLHALLLVSSGERNRNAKIVTNMSECRNVFGFDKTKTNFARKRVIITSILLLFFGFRFLFCFVQKFWHKCFICLFFFLAKDFQLRFFTVLSGF